MDRYDQAALDHVSLGLEHVLAMIPHQCASPIEVGLLKGFLAHWLFDRCIKFDGLEGRPCETDWEARIYTQHKVFSYRLDFAVHVTALAHGKSLSAWIGVECDGHEFHEKTKDQAARDKARDREITSAGYSLLRFSGSEIYKDNVGCARQVVQLAARLYSEWIEG